MSNNLHVIVGLGATGISCARYLSKQGLPIAVNDTRNNPPNVDELKSLCPDALTSFGKLDASLLANAQKIILSPGVALREPVIAEQQRKGIPIIGDIELFAQAVKVPVVAITGTNAKSTVTTLVGKMAEAAGYQVQTGGNLGTPALDLLHQNPKTNLFVLELSSFQLETTSSLHAQVASVLNVTPDHMDRYDTLAEYQQAKLRVYKHCHTAVCNRDDVLTQCGNANSKQIINFTLNKPGKNEFGLLAKGKENWLAFHQDYLLPINQLPVKGKHYQANALAALAIGYGFGLPMDSMISVLREFKGLPHRCQVVRELRGVSWINDSKGTNVGATQAAIEGLGSEISGKLIMIMGGLGKNADFHPLLPALEKYSRHIILLGKDANLIANVIADRIPTSFAKDMQEAVLQAAQVAQANDSVLLSPACASWDMFKNYEHRGDVFMEMVNTL